MRGIESAIDDSPLGLASIDTFQLKSEKLRQKRQKAQEDFWDDYADALRGLDPLNPGLSAARKLLAEYRQGKYPFSAAALDYRKFVLEAEAEMAAEP